MTKIASSPLSAAPIPTESPTIQLPQITVTRQPNCKPASAAELLATCDRIGEQLGLAFSIQQGTEALTSGLFWNENELLWAAGQSIDNQQDVLIIDWLSDQQNYRRQHGGGSHEALAKAVGIKGSKRPNVWDLTPGLGRDATLLANLGCTVRMTERCPELAVLLAAARDRAITNGAAWAARTQIEFADSLQALEQAQRVEANLPWDVLYLDPMYPARKKSALVKKELRLIKALVGDDPDSDKLLLAALKLNVPRVVVKRPKTAPPLAGKTPSHSIRYPNTRYDVYLKLALS